MDFVLGELNRFWTDLVGRADGPMTFRMYLQPLMALIAALVAGIKDAKTGRTPYFWTLTHSDPVARKAAWREGVNASTRILLLGVAMDVIYQFKVFGSFRYPVETFIIAVVLCLLPYVIFRGPFERIARWWINRR